MVGKWSYDLKTDLLTPNLSSLFLSYSAFLTEKEHRKVLRQERLVGLLLLRGPLRLEVELSLEGLSIWK